MFIYTFTLSAGTQILLWFLANPNAIELTQEKHKMNFLSNQMVGLGLFLLTNTMILQMGSDDEH